MMLALCGAAWLLSGCGGSSDSPAPVEPPAATDSVPPSASASAQGLKSYFSELGAMPVETKEPLDLGSFAPPAPEDTEPEPVS
jgi:hypothetical protein